MGEKWVEEKWEKPAFCEDSERILNNASTANKKIMPDSTVSVAREATQKFWEGGLWLRPLCHHRHCPWLFLSLCSVTSHARLKEMYKSYNDN